MLRVLLSLLTLQLIVGNVYMHSPRGSNNRNCEKNENCENEERIFNSQNNAKGGYACPRPRVGPNVTVETMYYHPGSKVVVEWTNSQGCGTNPKTSCEIVIQYACDDTLDPAQRYRDGDHIGAPRDGTPEDPDDDATDRIPATEVAAKANTTQTRRFGMHETYDYYKKCMQRSRNRGLYTADQINLERRDPHGSTTTRQTPEWGETYRRGLECAEERDYYPYWAPTPWRDIAVITSNPERCPYYQEASQNVMPSGECIEAAEWLTIPRFRSAQTKRRRRNRISRLPSKCSKRSMESYPDPSDLKANGVWYNNKKECEDAGHAWAKTWFDTRHPRSIQERSDMKNPNVSGSMKYEVFYNMPPAMSAVELMSAVNGAQADFTSVFSGPVQGCEREASVAFDPIKRRTTGCGAGACAHYYTGTEKSQVSTFKGFPGYFPPSGKFQANRPDATVVMTGGLEFNYADQGAGAVGGAVQLKGTYGRHYGAVVEAWVMAPDTGRYLFVTKGYGGSELWVARDPDSKGGLVLAVESKDSCCGRTITQNPDDVAGFEFKKGQSYYVKGLFNNLDGGSYFMIGWKQRTGDNRKANNAMPIPGSMINNNNISGTEIGDPGYIGGGQGKTSVQKLSGYLLPSVTANFTIHVVGSYGTEVWVDGKQEIVFGVNQTTGDKVKATVSLTQGQAVELVAFGYAVTKSAGSAALELSVSVDGETYDPMSTGNCKYRICPTSNCALQPLANVCSEPDETVHCVDGTSSMSRVNHLGNSRGTANDDPAIPHVLNANRYIWTVPNHTQGKGSCVIRLRYNVSSYDYPAWSNDGTPTTDYRQNADKSPIMQYPHIDIGQQTPDETFLSLAVNPHQYGRTFQDRSYVFNIKPRPADIAPNAMIYNVNVRGKRGNIVQTYPAVEYDFVPNDLCLNVDDYVHLQWTGSDYNPPRNPNNAEGAGDYTGADNGQASRADRTNLVETDTNPGLHTLPVGSGNNEAFPESLYQNGAGQRLAEVAAAMNYPAGSLSNWKTMGTKYAGMFVDDNGKPDFATIMKLGFIDQVERLANKTPPQTCKNLDELLAIRDQNRRERDPENCAKLNGAHAPYFDGGLVKMRKAGKFSYFCSRNNNFSNRNQAGFMCVGQGQCSAGKGCQEMVEADLLAKQKQETGDGTTRSLLVEVDAPQEKCDARCVAELLALTQKQASELKSLKRKQ